MKLPVESNAQRIGQMAEHCMRARMPLMWRTLSLEGPCDVGLDFHVQIVSYGEDDQSGEYTGVFRLQLKGTESAAWSDDQTSLSISLKVSTVRFWERTVEPIMLVVCDLQAGRDPNESHAYYVWVHDEIRRIRKERPRALEDNRNVNFRLSANCRLSRELDVLPDIERQARFARIGSSLDHDLASRLPDMGYAERPEFAENIVSTVMGSKVLLKALAEPVSSPWPQAPKGTLPGELNAVRAQIRIGRDEDALLRLDQIDLQGSELIEIAEYHYLRGLALRLRGDAESAIQEFNKAYETVSVSRYLFASVELEFVSRLESGRLGDLADLLCRLEGDQEALSLKARLLAAAGRTVEAEQLLGEVPEGERCSTAALIALSANAFEKVVEICSSGLDCDASQADDSGVLLRLLRARARFYLATKMDLERAEHIPAYGFPSIDVLGLRSAWEDIEECVRLFSKFGWPENTEQLVDIWISAATMLGLESQQLPILRLATSARPYSQLLQRALEQVAFMCGDFETALAANRKQGGSPDLADRHALLLYAAHRHSDCAHFVAANLEQLARADGATQGASLICGVLSAERMVMTDCASRIELALRALPNSAGLQASLQCARSKRDRGFCSQADVEALGAAFQQEGSFGLGLEYFVAIDVTNREGAKEARSVALHLEQQGLLPRDALLHLAQAYSTLGSWNDLLELARGALLRFPGAARFIAAECAALDKLGHTSEALEKLGQMIELGERDDLVASIYVGISSRLGAVDEAILATETLLENESKPAKRLSILRMLHSLVGEKSPGSARAEEIAWQMGCLVDQQSESEEGAFLATYQLSILPEGVNVQHYRLDELRSRIERFCERFPDSPYFSQQTLPESPTLADFEDLIERINPGSRRRKESRDELEKRLERGELPVHFALRPKHVFEWVPDVPSLWELCKKSRTSESKFHLVMADASGASEGVSALQAGMPLLDLTALLVINDLELFPILFEVFERVAVPQVLFEALRKGQSAYSLSWGGGSCRSILERLSRNLERLTCPFTEPRDAVLRGDASFRAVEDLKELLVAGEYTLYSDDVIMRIDCAVPERPSNSFCTLQLLEYAEAMGLLTPRQVAEKISSLCSWNVGVYVQDRFLLSAVPHQDLSEIPLSQAIDNLTVDPVLAPIMAKIWHTQKRYEDLHKSGTRLASTLICENRNQLEAVTALIGVWYLKAKFHPALGDMRPLKQLALILINVAGERAIDSTTAHRIWSVYMKLVEYEHGACMDECKEREGIELMGRTAAVIDRQLHAKRGEDFSAKHILERLRLGLTAGTASEQWFSNAYSGEWLRLARES